MKGIGILGGTFNPVHFGHLRYAIEVGESLDLDKVLLTPSAVPPHKTDNGLLSFELRAYLVETAIATIPMLGLNCLEAEISGPSFTYMSLKEWKKRNPGKDKPYFLMGMEDFMFLPQWHRGLDLPQLAHLVVAPRGEADYTIFKRSLAEFWPDFSEQGYLLQYRRQKATFTVPGGQVTFMDVPRLDISSSLVRAYWLAGRSMEGLIPQAELRVLEENRDQVTRIWSLT